MDVIVELILAFSRYAKCSNRLNEKHLPSTHSTNGYLCGHRVFLCNRARVFPKEAVPPSLPFSVLCQIHDLVVNLLLQLFMCTKKSDQCQCTNTTSEKSLALKAAPRRVRMCRVWRETWRRSKPFDTIQQYHRGKSGRSRRLVNRDFQHN